MLANDLRSAAFPLRNDRLAGALVLLVALAPVAAPSLVLIGTAALRDASAHAGVVRPDVARRPERSSSFVKFAQRIAPDASFEREIDPRLIAGGAPIRSARLVPIASSTASKPAAGARAPSPLAPQQRPARAAPENNAPAWVMRRFADVSVRGGLKLAAGSQVITLAGIRPPPPGASCRRLDGVMESCAQRAEDRLAVLVKGRAISCQIFAHAPGDPARGRCRAGDIDLAADLIRNGLGRPG